MTISAALCSVFTQNVCDDHDEACVFMAVGAGLTEYFSQATGKLKLLHIFIHINTARRVSDYQGTH